MVDTKGRAEAARLIGEFLEGRMTNDEFDEQYPQGSRDPALQNIRLCLWAFWSDLETHRLEREHALGAEQQALFQRCIAFLGTNLEYVGPTVEVNFFAGLKRGWGKIAAALGSSSKSDLQNPGWPFSSEEQFRQHSSEA
jgi:hypothetical protein